MEKSMHEEMAEPIVLSEEQLEAHDKAEQFFSAEAEKMIVHPGDQLDAVELERKKEEAAALLREAFVYLHGSGDAEVSHLQPQKLSHAEWDEVVQLAQEFAEVNGYSWKDSEGKDIELIMKKNGESELAGKFAHAKRPDGADVSVPLSFFAKGGHKLKLRNFIVNTRDGYTIHDVLNAISGKKYDSQGRRIGSANQTING